MAIRMQVTPVFSKNQHCYNDESKRYIVNSGGSRSSKTYSILQLFSLILMEKENYQIILLKQFNKIMIMILLMNF